MAAAFALLILLLSLASVSPQLHDVLHAHSDTTHHDSHDGHCGQHSEEPGPHSEHSEDHSCGVTLFSTGVTLSTPTVLPERSQLVATQRSLLDQIVCQQSARLPQSARGPPTRIVV